MTGPRRAAAPTPTPRLDQLPAAILDRIVEHARNPPLPSPSTTLLLISRTIQARVAGVLYRQVDLRELSTPACLRFALSLDPSFSLRLDEYTLPSQGRTASNLPSNPPRSFYPINPDNLFLLRSTPGAGSARSIRGRLRELQIYSRLALENTPPVWSVSSAGVPFAALPILLDVVRLATPLSSLRLDLPKSIRVASSQQADVLRIAGDIIHCLGKFGMLKVLAVDAWDIPDLTLFGILERCVSLRALTIRRATLSHRVFAPASSNVQFGLSLRRLTLTERPLSYTLITNLLRTFLNLESLQLIGYTIDSDPDLVFVAGADPVGQPRFANRTIIAPNLHSLVLRPSYSISTHTDDDRIVRLTALLVAVAPSLRHLHLSIHYSGCLLPLLSGAFNSLERLWIGFMSAQDEVGENVRLSRADDARVRPGLRRGVDVEGDREPLEAGIRARDGWVPGFRVEQARMTPRSRRLNERNVLARLQLLDAIVRQLVDRASARPWPPIHLGTYPRLTTLLTPFPNLARLLNIQRTTTLKELHVFETEYVGAFGRRKAALGGGGKWVAPGVRGLDAGEEAWKWLMAGQQGL